MPTKKTKKKNPKMAAAQQARWAKVRADKAVDVAKDMMANIDRTKLPHVDSLAKEEPPLAHAIRRVQRHLQDYAKRMRADGFIGMANEIEDAAMKLAGAAPAMKTFMAKTDWDKSARNEVLSSSHLRSREMAADRQYTTPQPRLQDLHEYLLDVRRSRVAPNRILRRN